MVEAAITGLGVGAIYLSISLGLSLIFGVMGIINFAQGDFVVVGAYAIVLSVGWVSDPVEGWILGVALAVMLLAAVGFATFFSAIRPLEGKAEELTLLSTFSVALILQGLGLSLFGASSRALFIPDWGVEIFGSRVSGYRLVSLAVGLVAAVALTLVLNRTLLGRRIRAIADDSTGARLIGIPVGRVNAITFVFAAILCVAGSISVVLIGSVSPAMGISIIFKAFAIVVVAGLGRLSGLIIASLGLGLLESIAGFAISSSAAAIISFAVVFMVLVLRPTGIAGVRASG